MINLLRALVSQERAVANARSASTRLSRGRVERQEVELFLEELDARQAAGEVTEPALPDHAREVMPR